MIKVKKKGGMHMMPGGRMMKDSEMGMMGYGSSKVKPKAKAKKKGK